MAKTCPSCGNEYVGLEAQCMPCRRAKKPIPDVTERDISRVNVTQRDRKPSRRVTPKPKGVTERDSLIRERWALIDRLGEINRILGPMTDAERKRRSRARRQDK